MSAFNQQVYEVVARIPVGKVISYGQIARILGKPRGAREVGWAMRNCPETLPWQRVVMADGSVAMGEYAEMRRSLLEEEGVAFKADGKVDMKTYGWEYTAP
jgi:methylated-DNA-protein-cysteine methyltransferase-like protein